MKAVPGTGLLAVRWPFREWRAVDDGDNENTGGGVQLLQIFSVHLSNAEPSDAPQRFSLRRGLDGVWSAKLDAR